MLPPPLESGSNDGVASTRGRWAPWAVLLGSALLFGILAVGSWLLYDQSEQHLLEVRTGEASQVLRVSVGNIQAPLVAAATIARVTDGDPEFFKVAMADQVGPAATTMHSAALYRIGSDEPIATVGDPLDLPSDGPNSAGSIVASATSNPFVVVDRLADGRRLGYAVVDNADDPKYVVYAERELNSNPNVRRQTSEPFAQLNYAIYLNTETPAHLLGSSLQNSDLPIDGRRDSASSPFGNQELLLVMTPIGEMSSWLFANLWWIVALLGIVLAVGAAWVTRSLLKRREQALTLAGENARLYDEQRHIAETLQLSLLPQALVPPPGGQVTARYWPAGEASLIGGDFYDAFRVDEERWAIVIGDVCGKGIAAAAITGLVRHTLRAASRNATSPADVLQEVHRALSDHRPSTFCTVCFMYVSDAADGGQSVTLALGGHPPPLLRRVDGTVVEIGEQGSLLGMFPPVLVDSTVLVEPGDTIVLYTDGLTDAPQEQAVPLSELVDLLQVEGAEPVELLADSIRPLKRRRRPHGSADDTAIVVVRFGTVVDASRDVSMRIPDPARACVKTLWARVSCPERGNSNMIKGLLALTAFFLIATFPATWLLMLFLGNVSINTSYWGTLPLGILVSVLLSAAITPTTMTTIIRD